MSETIRIAGDEKEIADRIAVCLPNGGDTVQTCLTGEDALKRIRETPPDLAVFDATLPDRDGFSCFSAGIS